ncbi:MAG TPA: hypothetical protein VMT20_21480, partial [Terriglobia bacterium]|nr:hypothetical protein [Terriglobia bacterium]
SVVPCSWVVAPSDANSVAARSSWTSDFSLLHFLSGFEKGGAFSPAVRKSVAHWRLPLSAQLADGKLRRERKTTTQFHKIRRG